MISEPFCPYGNPVPGVFCGRGPNRQDCEPGFFCNIDPLDRFAVCCPIQRYGKRIMLYLERICSAEVKKYNAYPKYLNVLLKDIFCSVVATCPISLSIEGHGIRLIFEELKDLETLNIIFKKYSQLDIYQTYPNTVSEWL